MTPEEMRIKLRQKLDEKKKKASATPEVASGVTEVLDDDLIAEEVAELDSELSDVTDLTKSLVVSEKTTSTESSDDVEKLLNNEVFEKLANNDEIKKIVENVSKNSELMDFISEEVKNPDVMNAILKNVCNNTSIFKDDLLKNPEIIKCASDPKMIKEALNLLKNNPGFFNNMKM